MAAAGQAAERGRAGWLRRLWAQDAFVYSLRVFIALSGAMALCWWRDQVALVTLLFLGIIASALAETDDSWRGRLRAVWVMLACFALAAFSVQLLLPHPAWFVAGLACSTFGFTMLGAIGERYRAIASATVILALYAAISASPGTVAGHVPAGGPWHVPLLLLSGAAWYALLSLVWCAAFPHQRVRQNLAGLYDQLGAYLRLKASLFEPVRGVDVERRRLALAQTNGRLVAALNATKESIFSRWGAGARALPTGRMLRHLNLYFIAQDIHERASSSHHHYNEWADVLFHSDVLYRCQRVLQLQGVECARIAQALQMHQPFERDGAVARAMADLRDAIAYLEAQGRAEWQRPLRSLRALARNLGTLDAQLDAATHPDGGERAGDSSLLDRSPRSLADAWGRVRVQLHRGSPLFRHAVRLSLALAAGHGVMQLIDPVHGYWIPLATLFVCQPTYGATLARVAQRIAGTAVGLVVGWALLRLFPSLPLQALFAVAAGVLFFVTRTTHYLTATAAITLLVLMCFNQATGAGERADPAAPAGHHDRQCHRRGGDAVGAAGLAGTPPGGRGGPGPGRACPLPARDPLAVRHRQVRRPGLPARAAQRAQRGCGVLHDPLAPAAGAAPRAIAFAGRHAHAGGLAHLAELSLRPGRAPGGACGPCRGPGPGGRGACGGAAGGAGGRAGTGGGCHGAAGGWWCGGSAGGDVAHPADAAGAGVWADGGDRGGCAGVVGVIFFPGPGCAPGGAPTFFCFAKRK
ncbi:YccS family putative transporter [Paracidovorax citrulli]|nr:YccS family putative transporter [Paracidovorax citrulli]